MKFSVFEQKLIKKIEAALPGASPGVMIQVHQGGRKICDIAVGDTYAYYDLASLTKIIFTTQAMMKAYQENKWNLKSKVKDFVKWFPSEDTLVFELLNHSAGMMWWAPLYRDLDSSKSTAEKWSQLSHIIKKLPIERKDLSVYSDIGFLTLSYVLEEIYQKNILEVWNSLQAEFYPRLTFNFHANNEKLYPEKLYAPTEKCLWRGRQMRGEVHDENAWALGGVSTHAGLFGSIDDMGWFGLFVRGQLQGISRTLIKQKTAQLFATRSRPAGKGDWALGYMMVTPGQSSAGDYFSGYSIGHTGFTGTSFWYDPAQDLLVSILSNRVAFGREIEEFKVLRPQIHNWIIEGIKRA